MLRENTRNKASSYRIHVKSLFLDYDGTISPLNASRSHSQVPAKMRTVLQRISRLIPVVIVSTKDLSFLFPRTPFAHAWCGIAGIEKKIGNTIKEHFLLETALERIALGLQYAKSNATDADLFVEEKRDSHGRTVAFCLDWRQASDTGAAKSKADLIASYCEKLDLEVIKYPGRPFYDVYPVLVDKGKAVREIRKELKLEDGALCMGDSEVDNSAFTACEVSLGVIQDDNSWKNLVCDYFVKSKEVADFLTLLLTNDLVFDSSFPMVKTSPPRMGEN